LKWSFSLPAVVQLDTSLLIILVSVKEGPVSDLGMLVEPGVSEAGAIWYCRSQFSSSNDW
jgi:hypothetical protein